MNHLCLLVCNVAKDNTAIISFAVLGVSMPRVARLCHFYISLINIVIIFMHLRLCFNFDCVLSKAPFTFSIPTVVRGASYNYLLSSWIIIKSNGAITIFYFDRRDDKVIYFL